MNHFKINHNYDWENAEDPFVRKPSLAYTPPKEGEENAGGKKPTTAHTPTQKGSASDLEDQFMTPWGLGEVTPDIDADVTPNILQGINPDGDKTPDGFQDEELTTSPIFKLGKVAGAPDNEDIIWIEVEEKESYREHQKKTTVINKRKFEHLQKTIDKLTKKTKQLMKLIKVNVEIKKISKKINTETHCLKKRVYTLKDLDETIMEAKEKAVAEATQSERKTKGTQES
ncbi:hypothetical protein JTB14_037103 [Gonioctena quinquepunctata]|nr:hypothetical protein JTB14_037103 [Gonioctena quinquepunctata]